MPIYEYRCSACGHELEALQKLSEPPLSSCPQCGKPALAKLMSAGGFQLKGSGWYATDFKGSGAKPAAKPEQGKESESKVAAAKTESKSETKSAGATETSSTTPSSTTTPAAGAVK